MKAEKEMCKDISTRQDQNCILMKEEVEQSPWNIMKFKEEEEDVLLKSMIAEHVYVVIEYERIPYEGCIQPVYATIREIGDGDRFMLCSNQHNREMPEEISRGTSESHVFKSNGLCMTAGIEQHLYDVFMQYDKE